MIKLLRKEIQLAASPLSYFFIGFGLMAFVPGYPILVGSFFVCLGLFQSFQTAREANDLTYTALLPVANRDLLFYIDRGRDADPYDFAVQRCGLQK